MNIVLAFLLNGVIKFLKTSHQAISVIAVIMNCLSYGEDISEVVCIKQGFFYDTKYYGFNFRWQQYCDLYSQ